MATPDVAADDAKKTAGLNAYAQGDMQTAYDTLKPLLKPGAQDPLLLFHLGKAAGHIGDTATAADCLDRYVKLGGAEAELEEACRS